MMTAQKFRAIFSMAQRQRLRALFPRFADKNKCWIWKGRITKAGYGVFEANGKVYPAHVVVYKYYKGGYPENLELDHLCRNTRCVNPCHLEPVTSKENFFRGIGTSSFYYQATKIVKILTGDTQ